MYAYTFIVACGNEDVIDNKPKDSQDNAHYFNDDVLEMVRIVADRDQALGSSETGGRQEGLHCLNSKSNCFPRQSSNIKRK